MCALTTSPAASNAKETTIPRVEGFEPALAAWIQNAERSVLRQMVELVSQPGVVSLAGGLPSPEVFPREELAEAYREVLHEEPRSLQYLPPYTPLIEQIHQLCARRGIECSREQILLTTGAQQALDVCARLLVGAGTTVVAEAQAYTGIHQVVAPRDGSLSTVRADLTRGMDPEEVEALCENQRPRMIYAVPEGHNPLGVTLDPERREGLVDVARRYGVPIVEDDPYGFLTYDGDPAPALAAHGASSDWVIYVGSFSKILGPALRLGWMVLPPALTQRARIIKEGLDLECSSLTQRVVSHVLARPGFFDAHLERIRETYRPRRDALLAALDDVAIPHVTSSRPSSGMFVWLRFDQDAVPAAFDTRDLLRRSLEEEKVAFIPGPAFDCKPGPHSGGRLGLRLSFSLLPPDQIDAAVRGLARSVDGYLESL